MIYKVWYMRPDWFRDGICGEVPDPAKLQATHIMLREVEAASLDQVYAMMQGEIWSPNGEARGLIESKGLAHTSMSVGDVIEAEGGIMWVVASVGFTRLDGPPLPAESATLIFTGNDAFLPIKGKQS